MMCSYVDKLRKNWEIEITDLRKVLEREYQLRREAETEQGRLMKNEERFQSALKDERVKRSDLMIGIVDLKNQIERMESFMESIGACTECCQDPCRCERRVVVPDV